MTGPFTKRQAQSAFAVVHKYAQAWTSHRIFCRRLKAEVLGTTPLPDCNCGFFDAVKRLDAELAHIRKEV